MPAAAAPAPSRRERLALLLVGVATFVTVGVLQSLFGPSFAALQERYGVGVAEVGTVVSAYFAGALVGVLAAGALLARLGYRTSLLSATGAVALGAAGVAVAPTWSVALAGALVAGLGFGQITVAVNLMVARAYGHRAAGALNGLNGTYGVGAVLGPALVALFTARLGPTAAAGAAAFGVVVLAALATFVATLRVGWWPVPAAATARRRVHVGIGAGVATFMLLFFLYVASEVSTPAWIPTHLTPRLGAANAALVASAFWASLTVGRFLVAPLASRFRPRDLVLAASLVAFTGVVLAQLPALAVAGYLLTGFGLAPIFPTTIAWLQVRFGDRGEQVTPLVLASGNLGPVLGAPAVGVSVAAAGSAAIPSVLAVALGALALTVAVAWFGGRRAERQGGTGQGRTADPADQAPTAS